MNHTLSLLARLSLIAGLVLAQPVIYACEKHAKHKKATSETAKKVASEKKMNPANRFI